MGRGKKNLKRRSGNRKVSRRINANKKSIKTFGAADVQAQWDVSKTAAENYAALGLTSNPNSVVEISKHAAARVLGSEAAGVEMVDLEELQRLSAYLTDRSGEGKRHKDFMKQDEMDYYQRLVNKHGENFVAMARDIKTNNLQHSAEHLETRIARMRRFIAAREATSAAAKQVSATTSSSSAQPAVAVAAPDATAKKTAGVKRRHVDDDVSSEKPTTTKGAGALSASGSAPAARVASSLDAADAPIAKKARSDAPPKAGEKASNAPAKVSASVPAAKQVPAKKDKLKAKA